jgi:hypothetical protein
MRQIDISVSGPVGCGKSAILAMIEHELRRRGFAFRYANPAEDVPEKNMSDVLGDLIALDRGAVSFVLRSDVGALEMPALADTPIGVEYDPDTGWSRIGFGDGRAPDEPEVKAHPLLSAIAPRRVGGQDMVAIPAFHYMARRDGERYRLWLSAVPRIGFRLHPAFMAQGHPVPEILIGAYEISEVEGQLASVAGRAPLTRVSLVDLRERVAEMGEGWGVWSAHELAAIQMLVLIDLGHPDIQSELGRGNVAAGGPCRTGESDAVWRGLHELWGNVWHWVDGMRVTKEGRVETWDRTGYQAWADTGASAPDIVGFPTHICAAEALDHMFLPTAATDDPDEAMLSDFFVGPDEGYAGWPLHGGHWNYGSYAGLFGLDLYNVASDSYTNIGGRLAKRVLPPAN